MENSYIGEENSYIGEYKFFDFSDGIPIDESMVEQWIDQCVRSTKKSLKDNLSINEAFSTISSGNTKVLCEGYRNNDGNITMYISVSTKYKQCTLLDETI